MDIHESAHECSSRYAPAQVFENLHLRKPSSFMGYSFFDFRLDPYSVWIRFKSGPKTAGGPLFETPEPLEKKAIDPILTTRVTIRIIAPIFCGVIPFWRGFSRDHSTSKTVVSTTVPFYILMVLTLENLTTDGLHLLKMRTCVNRFVCVCK